MNRTDKQKNPNLTCFQVHAEEISGNNGYVELFFCAKKLDDKVRERQQTANSQNASDAPLALKIGTCDVLTLAHH